MTVDGGIITQSGEEGLNKESTYSTAADGSKVRSNLFFKNSS